MKAKLQKKQLAAVDHSTIDYMPFRKAFYTEARTISNMSDAAVKKLRAEMEVKIRGRKCPRPFLSWEQRLVSLWGRDAHKLSLSLSLSVSLSPFLLTLSYPPFD